MNSLLNEYRGETDKGEQKGDGYKCASRTLSGFKGIYSFLNDNSRENEVFVGRGVCGLWAPTLRFYDFSLQILFQEIEIGHL